MRTARRRCLVAALTAALIPLAWAGTAQATITVANTDDSGPGSLRTAIADATAGETIVVPGGTYTLTSGELLVSKSLTISGNASDDTTIASNGSSRVFRVSGAGNSVTISGVTIRDGFLTARGGSLAGAGVLNQGSELTLQGVVVRNNQVDVGGVGPGVHGGIAVGGGIANAEGTLRLTDSMVAFNTASAVGGVSSNGGVAVGGGVSNVGSLSIDRSTLEGNTVDARGGQGTANPGQVGGVAIGGGVFTSVPELATFSADTVADNLADASGGPGAMAGFAEGGGLSLGNAVARVTNTTISGNASRVAGGGDGFGGGLDGFNTDSLTLTSDTITSNAILGQSVGSGGNLHARSTTEIANTIISDGSSARGQNCGGGAGTSLGFNIDSLDQCNFRGPGDKVNTDPLLGPLADNGGATTTMALSPGSPAVDGGFAFGWDSDQRGMPRPSDFASLPNSAGGDGSDIGAFELPASNPIHTIRLGKLKRNTRRGTAKLPVEVSPPDPGVLTLFGKGLRRVSMPVSNSGTARLLVIGKRRVRTALRLHGKRKIALTVTYERTGDPGVSMSRSAKLIQAP
jgi:hypothetical protein